ncbi:hypothetical protein ABTX24_06875 [Nocardioides sp. NPDC127514]|uniref:hypothetical protein n=1 Tax=Nocardioides sp. NPDC127514 TaxID=3154243 RepID=UPI00332470D9
MVEHAETYAVGGGHPLRQSAGDDLLGEIGQVEVAGGGLLVGVQVDGETGALGVVEDAAGLLGGLVGQVRTPAEDVDPAPDRVLDHRIRDVLAGEQADLEGDRSAELLAQAEQRIDPAQRVAREEGVGVRTDRGDAVRDIAADRAPGAVGEVVGGERGNERAPLLDGGHQVVPGLRARLDLLRAQRLVEVRVRLAGGGDQPPARGICPGTALDRPDDVDLAVREVEIGEGAVEETYAAQSGQLHAGQLRRAVHRTDLSRTSCHGHRHPFRLKC